MHLALHLLVIIFISATNSSFFDFFENSDGKDDDADAAPIKNTQDKKQRFQVESNNAPRERKPVENLYEKAMMLKRKSKEAYEKQKQEELKGPLALGKTKKAKEAKYKELFNAFTNSKEIKEAPVKRKKETEYKTQLNKEPLWQIGESNKNDATMRDTKKISSQFGYALDPVLNSLGSRRMDFRRSPNGESDLSSSLDIEDWKDEWRDHWLKKKFEAANSTVFHGDEVNMVAARPWGVPCGDPNQHDMPWGSCLLPMECEAEYRIYRGDIACGRTQFVCCALQLTNYDLYQGFDVSFEDSGLSTDTEETKNQGKANKKNKKDKDRDRRKKERDKRKRKIKKNIKKIVKEIRKILNKAYKNGTQTRAKRTKQLKKFIKELKKKYKKNRQSVKEIHELEMIRIDEELQAKLDNIRAVNEKFMENDTFRDIVLRGVVNKQGARMLVEAYPDLATHFSDNTRRRGGRLEVKDHPDYDVEYGMLYY